MAHVVYTHGKKFKSADVSKTVPRKHSHGLTPSARRFLHATLGFLLGFLVAAKLSDWTVTTTTIPCGDAADEGVVEEDVTPGNGSLVFVGVMTAQKFLETRAVAVHRTWGSELPGKLAFFSAERSAKPTWAPDLPLVRLKGVDDSYPPQKKSFAMLQYMWERYGDKFEWFLRADDDVYIRPDKLESFLRSIDATKPYFIGQAGRGNQEEFGLLSLEYDENFCMGGPGVIMSRETLRRVAPFVKTCLENLYTTHEDVELGRCVQKFAKISCTWSYEMQSIFYHNSSGNTGFTGNLKTKEIHRLITLHPIKQYKQMYRIHNYMKGLRIRELQQKKISSYRDLRLMKRLLEKGKISGNGTKTFEKIENADDSDLFGLEPSLNKYVGRKETDVFYWDFISKLVYSNSNANPRRKMESYVKEGLDDVIREVMDHINVFSRERGRIIEFQQILYGYHRTNPLYGADYILDILLTFKKYRGKKMTVPVRRHAYIQRQFTGIEIREVRDGEEVEMKEAEENGKVLEDVLTKSSLLEESPPFLTHSLPSEKFPVGGGGGGGDEKRINFILPLYGRFVAFVRFVKTFEDVCLKTGQNVALFVIMYGEEADPAAKIVRHLREKYSNASLLLNLVKMRGKFARAEALNEGMNLLSDEDLVLFVDVDVTWTSEALERIRKNTSRGKSAYFPVVFSEYDPRVLYNNSESSNHFFIHRDSGYWRQFGYGIASAYKEDIKRVGGLNVSIFGWGKEDVDLFEKFIAPGANMTVFRSPDPHLVHIFHAINCDTTLDVSRLNMCLNSRTETFSSAHKLADILYDGRRNIYAYAISSKSKIGTNGNLSSL